MDKVRNLGDVTAPGTDLSSLPPHLTQLVKEGASADTMSTFRQLLLCLMSEVLCSSRYTGPLSHF